GRLRQLVASSESDRLEQDRYQQDHDEQDQAHRHAHGALPDLVLDAVVPLVEAARVGDPGRGVDVERRALVRFVANVGLGLEIGSRHRHALYKALLEWGGKTRRQVCAPESSVTVSDAVARTDGRPSAASRRAWRPTRGPARADAGPATRADRRRADRACRPAPARTGRRSDWARARRARRSRPTARRPRTCWGSARAGAAR